jgi:hypothetical protein
VCPAEIFQEITIFSIAVRRGGFGPHPVTKLGNLLANYRIWYQNEIGISKEAVAKLQFFEMPYGYIFHTGGKI